MANHSKPLYLKDYKASDYLIEKTDLCFELGEESTQVTGTLSLFKNPESNTQVNALQLNAEDMVIQSVFIDGEELNTKQYTFCDERLTLSNLPEKFTLKTVVTIKPEENTQLEGLYKSGANKAMFCSQCEAEGFRRITPYLDRPDVMALFTTTIIGDKKRYPLMLSNGNLVEEKDLGQGRHQVTWEDPFKKPCYLFALVAGDLSLKQDSFTTMSGRTIDLRIYSEERFISRVDHAMQGLKKAMQWDEDNYGCEYDLDLFMIVAVPDFNMGAMENKGLNIFNTSALVGDPQTSTDDELEWIEAVVAHEYFHNWTGNRVTCRDWFQLSLKEGLTVYRDECFTADQGSPVVKRIHDVRGLRTVQFAEDAGPMAHPIRPPMVESFDNFYTNTVYRKGAQVVGMYKTILGDAGYRKGTDLYFARHDGQAVTCEDFTRAMEDATGADLSLFRNWYSQAGTPTVIVSDHYDAAEKTYTLTLEQTCPPTQECQDKKPFHIPLATALIDDRGNEMRSELIHLKQAHDTFVFNRVNSKPLLSINRHFSAPVIIQYPYTRDERIFLMANDSDGFNRWDAFNQLSLDVLAELIEAHKTGDELRLPPALIEAYRTLLTDENADKPLVAQMLCLPSEALLIQESSVAYVDSIHGARKWAGQTLAAALEPEFLDVFHNNPSPSQYNTTPEQVGQRALRNTALTYLLLAHPEKYTTLAEQQFESANNMTDEVSAFQAIVFSQASDDRKQKVIDAFRQKWLGHEDVMDHWLRIQATQDRPDVLSIVQALMDDATVFDVNNPNRARGLIGGFASNHPAFHCMSGQGYDFMADFVLDRNDKNPQLASAFVGKLIHWKKFEPKRQALMVKALKRLQSHALSKNVAEKVNRALEGV